MILLPVVRDIEFNRLSEEAKKLKEELGLYKKQIGSHQYKPKGENYPREINHRKNQYNDKMVAEFNESINEAIKELNNHNYSESAWDRLSKHLSSYENDETYGYLFKKANKAIDKFKAYIKSKKGE